MKTHWWVAGLMFVATGLSAEPLTDRLAAIRSEREKVSTSLEAQEDACQSRFAVTDCVNAVRKHRQKVMLPLQREENQILLQERQDRDRVRAQKMNQAQVLRGTVQLSGQGPPAETGEGPLNTAEKIKNHRDQAAARASAKRLASPKAPTDTRVEASNREAFVAKTAAAEKRQQERERRMKSRIDKAASLPVPP